MVIATLRVRCVVAVSGLYAAACLAGGGATDFLKPTIGAVQEARTTPLPVGATDLDVLDAASDIAARHQQRGSSAKRPEPVRSTRPPSRDIPVDRGAASARAAEQAKLVLGARVNALTAVTADDEEDSGAGSTQCDVDFADDGLMIFISRSMPDSEINAAFEEAVHSGAKVYFRGVMPGESLDAALTLLQRIVAGRTVVPDVLVDPRPFVQFGVTVVPSVVSAKAGKFVLVPGSFSTSYAERRKRAGATGRLAPQGVTYEIAEVDMMEEIKRRIEGIDWEDKQKQAAGRYWRNADLLDLPKARETATWTFDPSIEVTADVLLPNGRVVAREGDRINPLRAMPFTKVLVVFDATDPAQLRFARDLAEDNFTHYKGTILITTRVDRDRGWDAFDDYQEFLGPHDLKLLDSTLQGRFGFKRVPTVMSQRGDVLEMKEVSLP